MDALRIAARRDGWEQRVARNAGLGIGLADARNHRREIEICALRLGHELIELRRVEAAPPIGCRPGGRCLIRRQPWRLRLRKPIVRPDATGSQRDLPDRRRTWRDDIADSATR